MNSSNLTYSINPKTGKLEYQREGSDEVRTGGRSPCVNASAISSPGLHWIFHTWLLAWPLRFQLPFLSLSYIFPYTCMLKMPTLYLFTQRNLTLLVFLFLAHAPATWIVRTSGVNINWDHYKIIFEHLPYVDTH